MCIESSYMLNSLLGRKCSFVLMSQVSFLWDMLGYTCFDLQGKVDLLISDSSNRLIR
jgi:hypothetical protein